MNREQKAASVEDLRQRFASAPFVILTDFQGSTVAQMDNIRRTCEKVGIAFRVVKNTLAERAIAGTPLETLSGSFKGNTGVVFSGEDPQAAAKVLRELLKSNEKLKIRIGFFDGTTLDAKSVDGVADLPSKEQLLSTLLATIISGPQQLLGVLEAPARDLLYILQNYATKLETESGSEG